MHTISSANAAKYTAYPKRGQFTVYRLAILLAQGMQAKTDTINAAVQSGLKSSDNCAPSAVSNVHPVNIFEIISHA